MTTPREPELTDELLSAYIDNAVTPEERHIVEQAAVDDPDVAWRLQSLQMTVHLLHELPALALPRSFLLTPEQVSEQVAGSLATQPAPIAQASAPRRTVQPGQPGFWARLVEGWRTFWQSGSPALRNAMATSLVLFFVFLAAPRFMAGPESGSFDSVVVAPAAAPMVELARRSAPNPRATVTLRKVTAAETGARAADAARLAAPTADATLEQPVTTGSEAPVTTVDIVESADEPSPVTKMAAPESASTSDGATEVVAVDASAAAPVAGSGEDAVVAAAAMPAAAEAAPGMAVEAAPMALGALGAGPTLDQSPAQDADPLSAARAVAPAAESTGGGPSVQESVAPAMAAPSGAAAPLPVATSAPTQTPTAAPTATSTATPTVMPAAAAPLAPTAASVAIEQGAENTLVLPPVAAQASSSPAALPWLPIAQLVAAAGFLLFGLLWWQSRR